MWWKNIALGGEVGNIINRRRAEFKLRSIDCLEEERWFNLRQDWSTKIGLKRIFVDLR